jgi:hypothetical protein
VRRLRAGKQWVAAATIIALLSVALGGCGRRAYRQRADEEARQLINQKSTHPEWSHCNLSVYQDPRSRYFDPYNPDRPPKPVDDPTGARLMRCIYGQHGMKRWLRDGVTDTMVNPCWLNYLPTYAQITPDGRVYLDLQTANLLGQLHSRDYQRSIEEVYLSSLDVAFERFRFQCQYFGGNDTFLFTNGNQPSAILGRTQQGAARQSQTILDTRNQLGVSRRFAAGGQFLASIANSMVFQFSGDNTNFSTSVINYSLVQPILRGGGKIVTLETLTRSERSLLANLRSLSQFRQDFHRAIAVGQQVTIEPARIGGFSGGAGLTGFTGTGAGGFGGVGAGQGFGGFGNQGSGVGQRGAGGAAGLAGGGEGILDGFYGLAQRLQTIRNTEVSLASQELTLGLLEANFAAGLIDIVQVDEFKQNIETERANLLRAQVQLQDAVEAYLVSTLSLPPSLPVTLDDSIIEPFQIISPAVTSLQRETTRIVRDLGNLRETPTLEDVRRIGAEVLGLLEASSAEFTTISDEYAKLDQERESRLSNMTTQERRREFTDALSAIKTNVEVLFRRIQDLQQRVRTVVDGLDTGKEREQVNNLIELAGELSGAVQEIGLVQATIRVQKVSVERVRVSYDEAVEIARVNRLDWMNQRMALVDQWRLVAFNANRLLASLNIGVEGDVGTIGDSLTKFDGDTHNTDVSVAFDAPLNRKAERNLYREALIEYQRSKRRYVGYVDRVTLSIRSRLRQIERLEENLEIQRRALVIAIRRVDKTLEDLNQPTPPAAAGESTPQLGPLLAQNLLRALSDLRNTQDNYMSVWLNHEAARINLLFQLGIIEIAPDGTILPVSLDRVIQESAPTPPTEETPVPEENFLRTLEETTARGGDVLAVLEQDPQAGLVKRVEKVIGETISDEDVRDLAKLEESAEKSPIKRASRGLVTQIRSRLRPEEDPMPAIPKEDFPSALRTLRQLRADGLSAKEIAGKTGWDLSAVAALADAADLSEADVIQTIPVREFSPKPSDPDVKLAVGQKPADGEKADHSVVRQAAGEAVEATR